MNANRLFQTNSFFLNDMKSVGIIFLTKCMLACHEEIYGDKNFILQNNCFLY